MKPTAMQRSVEKDEGKPLPTISATATPKYSSTITVGKSNVRASSSPSVTPLKSRFTGEWTQIVEDGDGPRAGRGANVAVMVRDERGKNMPTLIASRDQRAALPKKSSSTTPSVKPSLLNFSAHTPSANPLQSQSVTSPVKSAIHVESGSSVGSSQRILPRSNSGGSGVVSPELSTVRVNGYSDSSMDSESDAYHLTDFYTSLPNLPADDIVSQHQPLSPPSQSPVSVLPSPPPTISEIQQNVSTYTESNASVLASSSPDCPLQTSETRQPKSSHRKKKKAPRPPPMMGIAENGAGAGEERSTANGDGGVDIPPETFHLNVKGTPVLPGEDVFDEEEASFAGQRDLRDARSLQEKQILSAKGTVRGFRNRVRAGIATFVSQGSKKVNRDRKAEGDKMVDEKFNYRAAERGQIVMYTTSMTVVRETYDRCKSARNILHTHMVRYEQRDVYLSHENQRQLRERMDSAHEVPLPQIFIDGLHLGGAPELEKLNESGELRKILHRFPKIQVRGQCDGCGGFRYVPCGVCHGSKKSLHRNHFTEEFSALRCTNCNENGLQRCPYCLNHVE